MILLYPLLLAWIAWTARSRRATVFGGRGWSWFWAWAAAGALFLFSLLTGLSVGLFVLPFAAAAGIVVARRSPWLEEALGFLTGAAMPVLLVTAWAVPAVALPAVAYAGLSLSARRT